MQELTSAVSETPSDAPPMSGVGVVPSIHPSGFPPGLPPRLSDDPEAPPPRRLLDFGDDMLTPVERWQIAFVQRTFESRAIDRVLRVLQRSFSANWIEASIENVRHVHGAERLPTFARDESTILVCNHRSFFDLYVVSSFLVKRGMPQRLMFPVRSTFFYDKPLGLAVNGLMSFFAMYPPLFRDRDRDRSALNAASVGEVVRLIRRGGAFVGLHPEGMRNKGDDPYALLPARSGVGRMIHATRGKAQVIPVFVNGLGNDIVKQISSNYLKNGTPVTVVFGEPIDFGAMLDAPASPQLHKRISETALEKIRLLGEEEREIRARL